MSTPGSATQMGPALLLTEPLRRFGNWRPVVYSDTLIQILICLPNGPEARTWRRIRAKWACRTRCILRGALLGKACRPMRWRARASIASPTGGGCSLS